MAAFAGGTQEVVLDATHQDVQANFELVLLSRAREAATSSGRPMRADVAFKVFLCFRADPDRMPPDSSMSDVVPSGYAGSGNFIRQRDRIRGGFGQYFQFVQCDERRRNAAALQRCPPTRRRIRRRRGFGGPGGGGGGGGGFGGGGPMVFGRRGFDSNRPHGSIYYGVGDSALNASPYSLTGQPTEKPAYLQNSFGGSVGGPLNIPHIYHGGNKTFYFINYNGKRGKSF